MTVAVSQHDSRSIGYSRRVGGALLWTAQSRICSCTELSILGIGSRSATRLTRTRIVLTIDERMNDWYRGVAVGIYFIYNLYCINGHMNNTNTLNKQSNRTYSSPALFWSGWRSISVDRSGVYLRNIRCGMGVHNGWKSMTPFPSFTPKAI